MAIKEIVKITHRGMITIPLGLRKKYHLNEGKSVAIIEDEGKLSIIPLIDIEAERSKFPTRKELAKIIAQGNKEDLELEK